MLRYRLRQLPTYQHKKFEMIYLDKNLINLDGDEVEASQPPEKKRAAITSKLIRKNYKSNGQARLPDVSEL